VRQATFDVYSLSSSSSDMPTTTLYPQEATITVGEKQLRIIDTPGLSWRASAVTLGDDELRTRDILLRSRGRIDRLKDPTPVVTEIVKRASQEDLVLFYSLPAFAEGNVDAFLTGVARVNGFTKKGSAPDLAAASRIVLRDWGTGKLPRYTLPPSKSTVSASVRDIHQAALSTLRTRKDMRKEPGLVKLSSGQVDEREVDLEKEYFTGKGADDSGEGDEEDEDEDVDQLDEDVSASERDGEDGSGDGENDEDVDMDDENEEEHEVPPPPIKNKRKLKNAPTPGRPVKKVAFAEEPKGTKQARSAAGARNVPPKATPKKPKLPKAKPPTLQPTKVVNSSSKQLKGNGKTPADGEQQYDFSMFFSSSK